MRVIMVRDCGHETDVTNMTNRPNVGDEVACWSSCDRVPARDHRLHRPRRVRRYETRED